jgi:hypothetical protein
VSFGTTDAAGTPSTLALVKRRLSALKTIVAVGLRTSIVTRSRPVSARCCGSGTTVML